MIRGLIGLVLMVFSAVSVAEVFAGQTHVRGYYRRDGTYVQPHIRSTPDSSRYNNFGPSRNENERLVPTLRDQDRDGAPNMYDYDDNNNGRLDQYDSSPYGNRSSDPYRGLFGK